MQISIFAAFVAGLISFLSPCVLPLVPGYISMLSGIGVEQLQQGERPRRSLFASSHRVCERLFGGLYIVWGFGQRGGPIPAAQ